MRNKVNGRPLCGKGNSKSERDKMKSTIAILIIFLATLCGAQTAGTIVTVISSSVVGQSTVVEITYPGPSCNTNPCTAKVENLVCNPHYCTCYMPEAGENGTVRDFQLHQYVGRNVTIDWSDGHHSRIYEVISSR